MSIDIGYSSPDEWWSYDDLLKQNAELRRRVAELEAEVNRLKAQGERDFKAKMEARAKANKLHVEVKRLRARVAELEAGCTCRRKLSGKPQEPGWYWHGGSRRFRQVYRRRNGELCVGGLPIEADGTTWYGPICEPDAKEGDEG